MKRMFALPLWLVLALLAVPALAVVEVVDFSDESLRPRYQQLIEELRCPKCQNQNLADSNSPISVDMRREVKRMLEEGKSDAEIKGYLTERYSEFILYRPEVKSTTLLLWLGPVLVLAVAVIIVLLMVRRQRAQPVEAGEPLDSDQSQRLAELLGEQNTEQTDKEEQL